MPGTAATSPLVGAQKGPHGRAVVLDTAALIAGGDALFALGGLIDATSGEAVAPPAPGELVTFYTVPEVTYEARDPRARARLGLLRDSMVVRSPAPRAVDAVVRFAKATGDFAALSVVDLKVLALAYMLESERNGLQYLRQEPVEPTSSGAPTKNTTRVVPLQQAILQQDEDERRQHEEREDALAQADGWQTVQARKKPQHARANPGKKPSTTNRRKKKSAALPPPLLEELPVVTGSSAGGSSGTAGFFDSCALNADILSDIASPENAFKAQESKNPATSDRICKEEEEDSNGTTEAITGPPPAQVEDMSPEGGREFVSVSLEKSHVDPDTAVLDMLVACTDKLQTRVDGSGSEEEFVDDGIGWINEDNLEQHLAEDIGPASIHREEESRVGCVTTDFAMQNVILQMGMKLVSVDGRRVIRSVRRYALRCQSCTEVTRELERKFCGRCGNASLTRVTFKVDNDGSARIFLSAKFQPRLRGTKYSIPMPRGGRNSKDLILCEDQIDPSKLRWLQKRRERMVVDVLDPNSHYNFGAQYNPLKPVVVGYGSRNPNQGKSSSKLSKRK